MTNIMDITYTNLIVWQKEDGDVGMINTDAGYLEFIEQCTGDRVESIISHLYAVRNKDPKNDDVVYFHHLGWIYKKHDNGTLEGWHLVPDTQERFHTEFFRHAPTGCVNYKSAH